ncbi:DUF885 domain-containing protein [Kribbella yunnanensis]
MSTPQSTAAEVVVSTMADELWQHHLSMDPYLQMRSGVATERLPLRTIDEAERDTALGRNLLARCKAVEAVPINDSARVTLALIRDHAERLERSAELWHARFPVTPYQLFDLNIALTQVLPTVSPTKEAGRLLALAEDLAVAVETMDGKLVRMQQQGWVLPAPAFAGSIATLQGLKALAEQALTRTDAGARVSRVRDELVLTAFDRLLARLDSAEYRASAPSTVGLSQFPGGAEAYGELARQSVTYAIDPEQVHRHGVEQLSSYDEQKAELRASLGFPDEADFLRYLRATGRLHCPTAQDVEDLYLKHISRMEPLVPQLFSATPKAPYGVARLDPAFEAGMSYGYYEPPTDAVPVGNYRYNGSGLEDRAQLNAATLIFHELIPGHHFHIARESEDPSLPKFRSQIPIYGAYNEGWAEYAASLAVELGLLDDPYDRYGHLVHQSFVCSRLVADTGLNALGMSLDEAAGWIRRNSFESEQQIASETLRYSTDWPGQALGYRLGYEQFWAARREAESELETAFDVRAFHEIVLGSGGRPLPMVRDDVRQWVGSITSKP